jgi:hypothetical protein
MRFSLHSGGQCYDIALYPKCPTYPMISQSHPTPPKPAASIEASTHFDVLWGKPLFRAPDLPVAATTPATTCFDDDVFGDIEFLH